MGRFRKRGLHFQGRVGGCRGLNLKMQKCLMGCEEGGGWFKNKLKRNFYHCKWCYLVILKDIGLNIQCRFKSNFLPLNA